MSEVGSNGNGNGDVNGNSTVEPSGDPRKSAPKDRSCPYCGQAFTSSSLGRHLDLYIKEKNPKAPDGIHDVDAIRKLRGGITRRQPRGSLTRRDASTPGTPTASSTPSARKSPLPDRSGRPQLRGQGSVPGSGSAIPKDGQFAVMDHQNHQNHPTSKYPFQPPWTATGVINDLPPHNNNINGDFRNGWDDYASQDSSTTANTTTRPGLQRVPSNRVAQKAQLDARQRLTDAMDTARAAELALREVLGSLRAAQQHIDMNSSPFDFDPFSLDFPALTIQCLQAPPTLFSSTPHPTSTSWSIQPPAQKQYEALRGYFQEEFRKWRIACATATTATVEELTYPPSDTHFPQDIQDNVRKAEQAASSLERQVDEHLQSAYHVWEQLSPQRKSELWGLELARGVGRRQKDLGNLKETNRLLKQECTNLKQQIEQLNRLQQPREFRIMSPATIPVDEAIIAYLSATGTTRTKERRGTGITLDDRHVDLNGLVSRAIERWKSVIALSKGGGMTAQRSLDQTSPIPTPTSATANPTAIPTTQSKHPNPVGQSIHSTRDTLDAVVGNGETGPIVTPMTGASTTAQPAVASATTTADEDNSDQDADAEMDEDDQFAPAPVVEKPQIRTQQQQQQQQPQLEVSQARNHNQCLPSNTDVRFVNSNNHGARVAGMRQSIPNMNSATVMQARSRPPHNAGIGMMNNGDYGPVVPSVGGGDPMYMD